MAINFPSSPQDGEEYTDVNSGTWVYDIGTNSWTLTAAGSASAFNFRGGHDFTQATPPSVPIESGDLWVHDGPSGAVNGVYTGLTGTIPEGQLVLWDGSKYVAVASSPGYPDLGDGGGSTLDDRYLQLNAGLNSQSVTGTGPIDFAGNIVVGGLNQHTLSAGGNADLGVASNATINIGRGTGTTAQTVNIATSSYVNVPVMTISSTGRFNAGDNDNVHISAPITVGASQMTPAISLEENGSAEFKGNISLGNTSSTINDGGIELNQDLGQIDIIKASADSGFYLTGVQSNGVGGVVTRFNIGADGNADFTGTVDAERVDAGSTSNSAHALTATNQTDSSGTIYARNNFGGIAPCYEAAGGDGAVQATISNDGSSDFKGDMQISAGTNGFNLDADSGTLVITNTNTSGAKADAFRIYDGTNTSGVLNYPVIITTGGNATFDGTITTQGGAGGPYVAIGQTITFNTEPDNDDNYTVTTEEYEEQEELTPYVPAVPATYDEEGNELTAEVPAVEATYQTVTKTREIRTYTGPTLDVKERLQNLLARVDAMEANEVIDDATDSSLLTLVSNLDTRLNGIEARIAALEAA